MAVVVPTLCELYAAGKLHEFTQVLRPSPATKPNSSSSSNPSSLGATPSKSPRHHGAFAPQHASNSVVNRRDIKGRTALHLAASDLRNQAIPFLDALLACPNCHINLPDLENGWTALHRALYLGNISAACMIMKRSDCDLRLKDREGLTPFDLFNATVEGTNPEPKHASRSELYTWGNNRNFNLGVNADGDRSLPESVKVRPQSNAKWSLQPISARSVQMDKFHTAVITNESSANLRLCGFGSTGRMGAGGLKITLEPLPELRQSLAQVALGMDHTVLLTKEGDVFTFGLNHHGQLGYSIDPPAGLSGKNEEPMQLSPRRVLALRKEPVAMIAAARYHTAVYTKSGILYTWGANRGQLGYSSDVGTQTQPRIVSAVPAPVVQIAASDFATGCLLATGEVFVFFRHTYFKMVFSASHFPASMQVYRPPSEMARLQIKKISGGGADWIAVSTAGDVFHWTLDDAAVTPTQAARSAVKLWNVRSGFTAVADAAIHGGSVILCTQSGHVFVGQRPGDPTKGADLRTPVGVISRSRQWKFSKIPFLQRATQVTTNGAGAFGAIRCDAHLPPIPIPSASLGKDLISILPHWNRSLEESSSTQWSAAASDVLMSMHEDDDYSDIQADCEESIRLFRILDSWDDTWAQHRLGSDIHLRFGDIDIPVHSHVLNFRSPTLAQSLASGVTQQSSITVLNDAVIFKGSHPLSGLLLTQFLYSDRSPCIWDSRILRTICCLFPKTSMRVVRDELQRLAHLLQLPTLARACGAVERINIAPSLADDLTQFLRGSDLAPPPDVSLLLSDTSLGAHSAILRARSPFFDAFFGNSIWTASRRQVTASSPLSVNLQHISSTLMRPVLEFMYSDDENPILTVTRGMEYPLDLKINQLMNQLADCESADARIDYISALLAVANEMLIDKLKTICAEALRPLSALLHSPISYTDVSVTVNLRTLAAILQEAHIHESKELSKTCLVYAISNMETILEGGYVFDLEPFIIEHLQQFAQHQQSLKAPLTRRKHVNEDLSQEQRDYVSQLDLALPPKAVARRISLVESPKVCPRLHPASRSPSYHVSPIGPRLTSTNADVAPSGVPSPTLQVSNSGPAGDDAMFIMDDLDLGPTESVGTSKQLFRPKSASTQGLNESTSRTNPDLRQIMSDAESAKKSSLIPFPTETPAAAISSTASASLPWRRPGLSGSSQRAESFLSIQAQQGKSAPQASPSQVAQSPHPRLASAANPLPKPSSSQIRQDPASGTGAPVISPVRSTSGATAGSRRRRAQDSAWVSYQTASSVLASASPSSSTGLVDTSFSAIQNAQQEEGDALRQRSKKTIGEIQQEEEFERWFAEESRRYQATMGLDSPEVGEASTPTRSKRGNKGGGRGRGRGGARNVSRGGSSQGKKTV